MTKWKYTEGLSRSKYHNHKVVFDGQTFDSERELRRYRELQMLETIGQISDLKRQVEYELIPNQRDEYGKLLERKCSYIADFVYKDENGNTVVEDTKGYVTRDYVIKRKLMMYIHHLKIEEV